MNLPKDLELFLAGRPILARRVTSIERLVSWSNRNRAIAALLVSIVLLIMVGWIGSSKTAWQFGKMAVIESKLREQADDATKFAQAQLEANLQNLYDAEMKTCR